jgi:hypothetical protein
MAASRLLIVLLATTLGLGLAPAFASAAPPENDHYWFSTRINQPGELLPDDFQDLTTNTDEATVQTDLFDPGGGGGGGPEVTRCDFPGGRQAHYGKTVWWDFFPDVDGEVLLQAAGFDAVIGMVPYNFDTAEPFRDEWVCADDPAASATETALFEVQAGRSYSIQIGGWGGDSPTGSPANADSGNLEFTFTFFPDSDGDGVLDRDDKCPDQRGKPELDGCPDDDNDNIRNSEDSCPSVPGLAKFAGCPDADDDGVPEPPDACPGVKGSLANGCNPPPPCADADNDKICDNGPDRCVGEDSRQRDANGNGCLDLRTFTPDWIFKPGSYFVRRGGRVVLLGVSVRRFGVANAPKGARVVVTCTRGACGRMSKRANSRVLFGQLRGDKLRAGVKVTIRVTAPGYVGRARVYTIEKNDWSAKSRCLMPGSRKLRTTCSPVR